MAYRIKTRQFLRDLVVISLIAIGLGAATLSFAQDAKPRGLTPHKTFELVLNDPKVLFVDVRDPIEIMFIGSAPATHVNIPFMFADRNEWNEKSASFAMEQQNEP